VLMNDDKDELSREIFINNLAPTRAPPSDAPYFTKYTAVFQDQWYSNDTVIRYDNGASMLKTDGSRLSQLHVTWTNYWRKKTKIK